GSGGREPDQLTAVNGTLFFVADDPTNAFELWKSDGTAAGTVLVKDINHGGGGDRGQGCGKIGSATCRDSVCDPASGPGLRKGEGTAAGTVLVNDINRSADSSPVWLTDVNGTLFFAAFDRPTGRELWKSDGTAAGTVLVKDISYGAEGDRGQGYG